jgi:hypothetical protein
VVVHAVSCAEQQFGAAATLIPMIKCASSGLLVVAHVCVEAIDWCGYGPIGQPKGQAKPSDPFIFAINAAQPA